MCKIVIFRSMGRAGSVVLARQLATLYETEIPKDLDEIVDDLEGDFYSVYCPELEEDDYEF